MTHPEGEKKPFQIQLGRLEGDIFQLLPVPLLMWLKQVAFRDDGLCL